MASLMEAIGKLKADRDALLAVCRQLVAACDLDLEDEGFTDAVVRAGLAARIAIDQVTATEAPNGNG